MVDDVGERLVEILCRELSLLGLLELDNELALNELDIAGHVKRGTLMGSGGHEGQESEKSFGTHGEEKKVKLKVRLVLTEGADSGLAAAAAAAGGEEHQNHRKWHLPSGYILIWTRDSMISQGVLVFGS